MKMRRSWSEWRKKEEFRCPHILMPAHTDIYSLFFQFEEIHLRKIQLLHTPHTKLHTTMTAWKLMKSVLRRLLAFELICQLQPNAQTGKYGRANCSVERVANRKTETTPWQWWCYREIYDANCKTCERFVCGVCGPVQAEWSVCAHKLFRLILPSSTLWIENFLRKAGMGSTCGVRGMRQPKEKYGINH